MPRIFLYLSVIQAVGSSPFGPPVSGDVSDKLAKEDGITPSLPSSHLACYYLHHSLIKMVPQDGIEPPTRNSSGSRSTDELLRHKLETTFLDIF